MSSNDPNIISCTADIVSAYVANNVISREKLPEFIDTVHAALGKASAQGNELPKVELIPAVPIKKSVTQDYLTCLEDGKRFKSLKRHLRTHHGLSPQEYRERWGLPRDYPMVAPAYASARSDLARSLGLGQHRARKSIARPDSAQPGVKPSKAGRKKPA